jgi:membrane associated rhomboid family serine protease
MLLPLGHEQTTVRRWPLVGIVLLLLNVAAFLGQRSADRPYELRLEAAADALGSFLGDHPHVELGDELRRVLDWGDQLERIDRELAERRRSKSEPSPEVRRREQAELDRLGQAYIDARAARPAYVERFAWDPDRQTVTGLFGHIFLHGDWWHLIGNMFFLYLVGPYLEDVWGRGAFLLLYLLGNLAATWTHHQMVVADHRFSIGASGAIAAVMGAFVVRFGRTRMRMMALLPPLGLWTFAPPSFAVLGFYVAMDVVRGVRAEELDNVAHWAHVGGFALGLAFALVVRLGRLEERWLAPAIEVRLSYRAHPDLLGGIAALDEGRALDARRLLLRARRDRPDDADVDRELARCGLALGDGALAVRHAARRAAHDLAQGHGQEAVELQREFEAAFPAEPWPRGLTCKLARAASRAGDDRTAAEMLEGLVRREPQSPEAVAALAHLSAIRLRQADPRAAARALERAARLPGVPPARAAGLAEQAREIARRGA